MDACAVGLGTLGLRESAEVAVESAVEMGCSLIDTGEHYGNLASVGSALSKCTRKPFVIVKLSGMPIGYDEADGGYATAKHRMKSMLSLLGIERADLCLMHWPGLCSWDPTDMAPMTSPADFQGKASSFEEFCDYIEDAWKNMTKLKEEGLCVEIGTSNFYAHHLEELAKRCDGAAPYANEIFIDVTNQETDFVKDMQEKGIRVLAYRPVAYKPYPDQVQEIAKNLGSSPQSVILAWLLRRGVWPLVKCRGDHIKDNVCLATELKDKISDADMSVLEGCEAGIRLSAEWFAKIWKTHNQEQTVNDEDVQMLVGMGVDEDKARAVLEKCGGDLDAAMDLAFME